MISKKLLDVVYPTDETQECYVDIQESTGRVMWFGKKYKDCRLEIDIYRVASECKLWALNEGYYLRAEQGINYKDNLMWTCFLNKDMNDGAEFVDYWNITEPEAIFKASEWILEQTQNKKDYK